MTRVLITGAGAVLGQGMFRALRRSSLEATIAVADPSPLSAGLYWGDEAYLVPMATDPAFLGRFADILDRARPDIVLVGTDVELPVLAEHRAALEASCCTRILVSDPRVVAIADDKYRTFEFFRDAGLDPPLSALPEEPGAVEKLVAETGFPLVVKPRVGARSVGVSVVHDDAALEAALSGKDGLVVQECVGAEDREYTSSALVFDGEARASIVMRRDLRDGNTYRAFAEDYPELNAAVKRFGETLRPFGPANFQFRVDSRGKPRVFEINARFSGATPLRALVGFNEVEMCIRKILFGEEIVQPEIEPATLLRHWSETLVRPPDFERIG